MEETKKRDSRRTGLMILLATAGMVTTVLFFMMKPGAIEFPFHVKGDERAAVFGGWTYTLTDQRRAAGALAKAGLSDYEWSEGKLLVPSRRRADYERVLGESQAFPQEPSDIKREALDAMGTFEPESRTKLRDLLSSARQLEKTLEGFDRIESASVGAHSRREQSGLHQRNVVTATITVKTKENRMITPELISAITLTARHHLGITDNADVSIIDAADGRSFLGSDGAVGNLAFASYSQEQLRQENLWREKFLEAFGHIPGIRVATTIDLTPLDHFEWGPKPEETASAGDDAESSANETSDAGENVSTAETDDSEITPVRHGGLLFDDDDGFGDEKTFASKKGQSLPEDRYVRFRPRTVAVSIAIPESYIRRVCGFEEPQSAAQASEMMRESAFQEKSGEVIRYVRETAATLLTPLVGSDTASRQANLVEVSLYGDLTALPERALYPQENISADAPVLAANGAEDEAGVKDVSEDGSKETAGQGDSSWRTLYQNHAGEIRLALLCVLAAFFAGFLIRSVTFGRKKKSASELDSRRLQGETEVSSGVKKGSCAATSTESRREETPGFQTTLNTAPDVVRQATSMTKREEKTTKRKTAPSTVTQATFSEKTDEAVKAEREREIATLFDDLPDVDDEMEPAVSPRSSDDGGNDDQMDGDEEVIGPGFRAFSSEKDDEILFTSSSGGEKNYRIETVRGEKSGPHFPLSAIQKKRREEGERDEKPQNHLDVNRDDSHDGESESPIRERGFTYSLKRGSHRNPVPPRDSSRFQFLLTLTPEILRSVLIRQRPQAVALIARSLSEDGRRQLLAPLGLRFREEIEKRTGEMTELPEETILAAVETTLKEDLARNDSVNFLSQSQHE